MVRSMNNAEINIRFYAYDNVEENSEGKRLFGRFRLR